MRLLFRAAVSVLLLCLSGVLYGQSEPSGLLLVLSKKDQSLSIVDVSALRVIAYVPVGNDPHEVIASADGTTAYVSNYGFGAFNTLAVVDIAARKALPVIDLGPLRGPHGITFAEGKTWFTAEAAKAIGRYDPSTHKVDWILGTGQNRTHMIHVSEDGQHIVTTNVSSGTVSIIEQERGQLQGPPGSSMTHMDWNETVIYVGSGSEGFDVSPDGKAIWVATAQDGTISVIDIQKKKVVQTLAADVPGASRLKFTPDGKYVLVSRGPEVVVFDVKSRKEIKRIAVGHGSAGILVQPDSLRAFVSCSLDNYVAVIDLVVFEVTGHIEVGREPDGLAWAVRH